ncbi:tRNA (adenosine(37)-N6)-dimethylallyltransferase MiaA [Sulfurimonas sp. SWIR-19]|uniref:tRNA (adenosine(37)-N6)-dimethylallyltransferase MiaA n=1 Tax=Sulfurimonas sp. SWIR-19 TaxID=2878390 RepID=UPI001CF27A0E|nr:tRNA (adenosine(37)-N6)-dimethylallyltransferase MiaA [Sulfurimonas sp. SWIR-19]UCN00713.1 tRNA (adenosine(37)-N6)-dimethylallyltransferase MiaA [Sulfurimonas sp. SWIR-19]
MSFKQIAIIGPTASGKSDLAISVAQQTNACILSIDSLSIYKEIDIVSAKPSKEELAQIKHYGINELFVNEYFSVDIFIDLYKKVCLTCKEENKNLVIVGGTSFYLKSLLDGLSALPDINAEHRLHVKERLQDLQASYDFLTKIDTAYMQKIAPHDKYRIEKALLIYEASGITPSQWFNQNPPKPVITDLQIYNIDVERDILRQRIEKRTQKMYKKGLIDEVCFLEQKYTRAPHAMGAIGIVEVLDFLDGKIEKDEMLSLIATHTAQLAKRQQTFNRTQFQNVTSAKLEDLPELILSKF